MRPLITLLITLSAGLLVLIGTTWLLEDAIAFSLMIGIPAGLVAAVATALIIRER